MKWDNTDLRVGLMVFGALLLGIVSFLWVGRAWSRNTAPLYTDVVNVEGLGAESPVILNGFPVGRVSDVTPRVGDDGKLLFRVRMNVVWRLDNGAAIPLVQGIRARVQPPTLDIGRGQIVLEMPKAPGAPLQPGDVVPSVQLGGTTNRMQLVVDSVGRDLRLVIASVEKLVASMSVTVAQATKTMHNANTMIAGVNQELPGIVGGVRANLASADSLLRALHSVTPATVATLDSVRGLLGDSRTAIARATSFLDESQPQISSTLANLDQASAVLTHMLTEISRRPIKAITGVRPPERPDVRQAGATTNGSGIKP